MNIKLSIGGEVATVCISLMGWASGLAASRSRADTVQGDEKIRIKLTSYRWKETEQLEKISFLKTKVKWCICIAPFPYGYTQRRFTMTGLPHADRKHILYTRWSTYAGTHFTDPRRMES